MRGKFALIKSSFIHWKWQTILDFYGQKSIKKPQIWKTRSVSGSLRSQHNQIGNS